MVAETLPSGAIMVMSAVMALSGALRMVRSARMAGPCGAGPCGPCMSIVMASDVLRSSWRDALVKITCAGTWPPAGLGRVP